MQVQYCRDIDRVHFGKAPSIGLISTAYGRNTAEAWLEIQLQDLSLFAGCKEKLSIDQIKEMAQMIVEEYPHYKVTEFMLFFQHFKRCQYGRFYGTVDPMIIFQALSDFNHERAQVYQRKQQAEEKAKREADNKAYEELKQRYMRRIPHAFTGFQLIDFLQYRLMGYDSISDEQLAEELQAIEEGRKYIPKNVIEMLNTIRQTYEIND